MKKIKLIFIIVPALIFIGSCTKLDTVGEFDLDPNYLPEERTDGPLAPLLMTASYDEYCDMVILSWEPTTRTTGYDIYRAGSLIADNIADTSFTDTEAVSVDTEYWVFAKNENGASIDSAFTVGRKGDVPPDPVSFSASDGEFESKVELTWDDVDFAKYYIVMKDGVVMNDSVTGNAYADNVDVPQVDTEYSLIAVGPCGQSSAVSDFGKADSLLKYSIIMDENYDGLDEGFDLSADPFYFPRFKYTDYGPGTLLVSTIDYSSPAKCAEAKLNDPSTLESSASIQIVFQDFELLVGQRYRISYNIKTPAPTSMHIGVVDDENGIPNKIYGVESYLLPTAVNPKNNNLYGIKVSASPEWRTVSYEFPATGTGSSDVDPDPEALGWTPTTIQAGQEMPKIMIAQWVGKGGFDGVCPSILIDDLKIELIK